MSDPTLREEIQALYQLADRGAELPELLAAVLAAMSRHPEELRDLSYRYRLEATDTGYQTAFALEGGLLRMLGPAEDADVTVTGKQKNLELILQRKLTPLAATLGGKVKVKGSMAALVKLAAFL